jgi:hypothetical protein
MARRSASARPRRGSDLRISNVDVVRRVAAAESTAQCDTSKARTLCEAKPTGACPLARWAKNRHEEILRMYNEEPAECRTTDLGKNLEKTLKVWISQEDNMSKKHCRRN